MKAEKGFKISLGHIDKNYQHVPEGKNQSWSIIKGNVIVEDEIMIHGMHNMSCSCCTPLSYKKFLDEKFYPDAFILTKEVFLRDYDFAAIKELIKRYCNNIKAGHWLEIRAKLRPVIGDVYDLEDSLLLDKRYVSYYYSDSYNQLSNLRLEEMNFSLEIEQGYEGSAFHYDLNKQIDLTSPTLNDDFEVYLKLKVSFENGENEYIFCTICTPSKLVELYTTYFNQNLDKVVLSFGFLCCYVFDYEIIINKIKLMIEDVKGCSKNEILIKLSRWFDVSQIEQLLSESLVQSDYVYAFRGMEEDFITSYQGEFV